MICLLCKIFESGDIMRLHLPIQPVLKITALNECKDSHFYHPRYFPGEFHPFWELVYVLDGEVQAVVDENIYTIGGGDMVIYNPMAFHSLWTMDHIDAHVFIIGFSLDGEGLASLDSGAYTLNPAQQTEIEQLLEFLRRFIPKEKGHLLEEMVSKRETLTTQTHIFANKLEIFLLSLIDNLTPLSHGIVSYSAYAQTYRTIVTELSANLEGWITTKEIAAKLHCSTAHVNQVFARYSDIGVHKYLLKLKIAAAIRMLYENVSVSDISTRLGFSNQNYFSSVFKRETGFSPTQYVRLNTDSTLPL